MAPHVIEKADTKGENRSALGALSRRARISEGHACERWAVSLTGAAETSYGAFPNKPQRLVGVTRSVQEREEARTWVQIANPD